ncbi:MAG: hypothetical protein J0J04_07665 [Microbacterium sp.]|uniref:ribonuclease HI n=1 Tax=Microbacterium sp. TaxID=51671 RepID=UPI001ACF6D8C|nr:hypothetical protein [Microbacterium sp.]MBN9214675.1 hypothetical protein [Microbacterium sp.]
MTSVIAPPPAAPPTPRALSRPATGAKRHAFDVASELSDNAVAWCIRDLATGKEERFLRPRNRGDEVLTSLTRDVAAWVDERADGAPVSLRCFSVALRDAIGEKLDPARYAPADLMALNASAAWAHSTRASLREDLARYESDEFHKRVLYGASDGSVHPLYGNGAYAWVTADGKWFVGRSHAHILASEVMGILSFTRAFLGAGRHYRAVLFVDSLNAIDAVTSGSFVHSRIDPDMLDAARSLLASGRLELIWVRSHQGHPLNDIADRLALQRHRAVRSELDTDQVHAICQQIVDGELAQLAEVDWKQAADTGRTAYAAHLREHARAA